MVAKNAKEQMKKQNWKTMDTVFGTNSHHAKVHKIREDWELEHAFANHKRNTAILCCGGYNNYLKSLHLQPPENLQKIIKLKDTNEKIEKLFQSGFTTSSENHIGIGHSNPPI